MTIGRGGGKLSECHWHKQPRNATRESFNFQILHLFVLDACCALPLRFLRWHHTGTGSIAMAAEGIEATGPMHVSFTGHAEPAHSDTKSPLFAVFA